MARSKERRRWADLPPPERHAIERLVGDTVVAAENCPGGYSPGLAARLELAGGGRVFVKAVDVDAPEHQLSIYRAEVAVAAALPPSAPAPRFLGAIDEDGLVALAFEDIEGSEPSPWSEASVAAALDALLALRDLPPPPLHRDHPRLGGWTDVEAHALADRSAWAASNLARLIELERAGFAAAQGNTLTHFDLYAHNVLMSQSRAYFVDWPHARLASPIVDAVTVIVSAAADGLDPTAAATHPAIADHPAAAVDAILAAVAGFLVSGAFAPMPPGLEPIAVEKWRLGRGALCWLERRL